MRLFRRKPKPKPDYTCPFCHKPPKVETRSERRQEPRYEVIVTSFFYETYRKTGMDTYVDTLCRYSCPEGHMTTDWDLPELAFHGWTCMCNKINNTR